jgi:flagellar secretion chaperone FliS
MSGHANAYGAYRSAEITTASQKDLIVRLYLGAEKFLDLACQAMAAKKYVDSMTNCRKARDIFMELMSTLNFEQGGELAIRLKDLYAFLVFQISEASLRKNPEQIQTILPIIRTMREGWENVPVEEANTTSIPVGNEGHALNFRC